MVAVFPPLVSAAPGRSRSIELGTIRNFILNVTEETWQQIKVCWQWHSWDMRLRGPESQESSKRFRPNSGIGVRDDQKLQQRLQQNTP